MQLISNKIPLKALTILASKGFTTTHLPLIQRGSRMMNIDDIELKNAIQSNGHGVDNPGFEAEEEKISDRNSEIAEQESGKESNSFISKIFKPITAIENILKAHSRIVKYTALGILSAGYVAYFAVACWLNFQKAIALVVLTSVAVFFTLYDFVKRSKGDTIKHFLKPAGRCFKANIRWIKWVFILVVVGLLVAWLAVDTRQNPEQLISLGGVCFFILSLFIFSAKRYAVRWRTILWGLGLQFAMGLFVIRTEPGFIAFNWLGAQIQTFLNYTHTGSKFVFGSLVESDREKETIFAFQALPIVIFFSSIMSVLYFLGVMQWIIIKISWIMQITMGTSPTESLSVAGNIFVGQTEAPLLILPYLKDMTRSEIHAVIVGGFATIAGSVMGAFISFGINASYLISASVMAAPCALAMSKLSYPETEESKFKSEDNIKVEGGGEKNILEAASNGASASVGLVANIAANLIGFLSILAFINAALSWLGGMVGYPDITFEVRSEIISTYALCGFANFSSLGIVIGGLSSICPSRKSDISALVLRALLTGTCVSLVNASVAGLLCLPQLDCIEVFKNFVFNTTDTKFQTCCYYLYESAVKNETVISFGGSWSMVKNATLYFTQCCDLYNGTVCI
ncbi:sodium/nucleoside cotransporter 1 isoform X3 [Ictalurus punctatus]|uniref:Sodium/nucleoside cotransporter 1 isoform X3 n=1 Tax=Ictalurus punctatus TaxID=7998 RepID=A0A979EJE1_ICTPU|nr:sodium/nucleoside cotransporter 1 isoform X3 [Ictalurus punctatus]